MKKIYVLLSSFFAFGALAQNENVGIGTLNPDRSAVLEINSNNKGLLLPRMSQEQRNSIQNPAKGLILYQTDNNPGFYYNDGNEWKTLNNNAEFSVAADPNDWTTSGNTGLSAANFLGTTDTAPLTLKVNNGRSGLISTTNGSPTVFGYLSGLQMTTAINNTSFGYLSLYSTTIGSHNGAFGYSALQNNTTGQYNFAMGSNSLLNNTIGGFNLAIGAHSLILNTSGSQNSALGTNALQSNTTGSNNIGLGYNAGYNNQTGDGNIFIGASAGFSETGNAKLYIANTSTTMPLVYGDFAAKYVTIGDVSPALRTQGAGGGYNLLVKNGILTEKVKVAIASPGTDWADYVFEPEYKSNMMSLEEVEQFTLVNKHLPNVPSANKMVETGLDVAQTSKMFMEKIEELTLYMIEMNKEIKALKAENTLLKK